MKIIDAHTGREMKVGELFLMPMVESHFDPSGRHTETTRRVIYILIESVKEGVFSATARIRTSDVRPPTLKTPVTIQPLIVRYTHPGFFLKKVAFFPS